MSEPLIDEGKLWSALRGEISYLRDEIKRAAEAENYEVESALFDLICRRLASGALERLNGRYPGAAIAASDTPTGGACE